MPDQVPAGQNDSGGSLRDQLEAALARENATRESFEQAVGLDKGSLKGTDPAQFADRAAEIKAERVAADRAAAARFLGVSEDELDATSKTQGDPPPVEDTPQGRTAGLAGLGGRPAHFDPAGDEMRDLTEGDLIKAALLQEAKQR